ncbi:large ribosomal subunit protein eL28-like [Tubulanus polymorphus]|uniref:large ribosomal subunit protein eL28-like n=1 Tax=Tubulanus polymorphus TaxID=672921 RepID=UPI003DA41BD5
MSSHLTWAIIRNNSAFLRKGARGCSFTTEANNLKGKNSFKYNGLIHKQTFGVEAAKDGKGVVIVTKKARGGRKPSKSMARVELKKDARRTFATISKTISKSKDRRGLKMAALRRASAILQSQKPVVAKKAHKKKRE